MSLLTTARFHTTVAQLRQLPRGDIPEVAFVGRSNAGKSSAINVLCNRRRLAFASRTPGRTQALNFFAIGPEQSTEALAYLVDTPGYGYAQAPKEIKQEWDQLGGRYLQGRRQLAGVVLIADVRRGITALDTALLAWVAPEVPLLVIMSKCDKLNRQAQINARREMSAAVAGLRPPDTFQIVPFSATGRVGLEAVTAIIEGWVADAPYE